MTKHTHKYPTAFQIVQRWFSGVLHLWASLHRAVPHKTTAHLAMAHTDTQTCNATDAKSSHNLLWLLLQRNLLHSLPPPAKLFLSQLSFSKDEVQPYRKGTTTTMLFKESKKTRMRLIAPSDHGPVRGRVLQGKARRKGKGERGWMRGNRDGKGGKKGERGAPATRDTGKRRRNGETRRERDRQGRWGPAIARTPSRSGAVPARSGEQTAGAKHRRQPPTVRTRSPWACPRSPSARPGHSHSPGPPQRERRCRRPRDPGAGRAGPGHARRRLPRGSRETPPRPAADSDQSQGSVSPASLGQPMGARPPSAPCPPLAVGWGAAGGPGDPEVPVSAGVRVFPVSRSISMSEHGGSTCLPARSHSLRC